MLHLLESLQYDLNIPFRYLLRLLSHRMEHINGLAPLDEIKDSHLTRPVLKTNLVEPREDAGEVATQWHRENLPNRQKIDGIHEGGPAR